MAKVFQKDTNNTLTTGLVSYYKLNDETDFFGSNNLTNNNGATFVAGKVGNAVSLNGTNQYLSLASPLSTQTTNVSMFMWVYVNTASEKGAFVHNGTTVTNGDGYSLGVGSGNFDTAGNNLIGLLDLVAWMDFGTAVGTGWHFVGMTRDATTWKGWIDNVQAATTFTTNPNAPTGNFQIGRDTDNAPRLWSNKIDELGFWNKALSAQEISDLYNGGAGQTMIIPPSGGTMPLLGV